MFLKPDVRKSLLAKMLSELLDTRVMVKGSMKAVASDRVSGRCLLLPSRYLKLTLISTLGSHQIAQRSPTSPQILGQCYLRLHFCDFLWSNACC